MLIRINVAAILLCVLVTAGTAEARRGVVIYNYGEDIFEAGPLPEPFASDPELAGASAGFKCQVFGLFFAYLHTWDCTPVAFQGDAYDDSAELSAAIGANYSIGDVKMGFWPRHGRWFFAGAVVLVLLGGVGMAFTGGADFEEEDDEEIYCEQVPASRQAST